MRSLQRMVNGILDHTTNFHYLTHIASFTRFSLFRREQTPRDDTVANDPAKLMTHRVNGRLSVWARVAT